MASKTLAAVRWALPNLPRPMSRSFSSAIACLLGLLSPTSAKGTGAAGGSLACGTQPKTSGTLPFVCSSKRACNRRKDLGMWCGTPSLDQVGRFFRACAAFGIPAGEHSLLSFPRRTGLLFIHSGTPCRYLQCRSTRRVCTFTGPPHQQWKNSRQNNQPLLSANMPHCIAFFFLRLLTM